MPPTPLVLIHGNPETAVIWGPLIAALDRAGAVALSPPGFGVPAPRGFDSSMTAYRDWLVFQLELFRAPVDLVGHDWGGIHVAALAMSRPDLIRSWASDALGVFAPDYVWHPRAQAWQQEGPGEASVRELWGGDLEQRLAVTSALGMTGRMAERVAAGMDPEMGNAVLKLLRSAFDGEVFDRIPPVERRYARGHAKSKIEVFKMRRPVNVIQAGYVLRVIAQQHFRVRWTADDWKTSEDLDATALGYAGSFADLPTSTKQSGQLSFTLFWTEENRWEGRNFDVAIE